MEIVGRVAMTRARYGRMVRMVQGWMFVLMPVLGGLSLLVTTAALVRGTTSAVSGIGLLVCGALLALAPWLSVGVLARRLRLADSPIWTYRLTPTGLTQSNPVADTTVRWEQIVRRKESTAAWALKLRAGGWLVLPKDAFDPAELARVSDLITADGRPRSTS